MTGNTAVDEVSRMVPDSATMTDEDKRAVRKSTMDKVCERLREATERLTLIDRAVIGVSAAGGLPELIAEHSLGEAVDTLTAFDDEVTALAAAALQLAQRVAYAKEVSMPTRMDEEEIKTFNTDKNRITRTARVYASIIGEQEDAFAWLRDNGYGPLIKETCNASSLSGAAKEMMEQGIELPEDLFRSHTKDSVSITRKKK